VRKCGNGGTSGRRQSACPFLPGALQTSRRVVTGSTAAALPVRVGAIITLQIAAGRSHVVSVHIANPNLNIMDKFHPNASNRPHGATSENPRFKSQAATAEDLLKAQTVGLVNLNDYRKRRAEALDLKEREATTGVASGVNSGASTPAEE
jgi:hypothetical protein